MISIGATSLGFGEAPLPRILDDIRSLGGDCVELNTQPGLHAGFELSARTAPKVVRWARDAGVEVLSLGGYNDFAQDDPAALDAQVDRLQRTCELAARMGVGIVRAFVGEPKQGLAFSEAQPTIVEAFRRSAAVAAELGVTLAIENHGRLLNDGAGLASLVGEIGSQAVGLTLDTGNFCWAGHDLEQATHDLEAAIPHAVSVHVKDGVWRNGTFEFVPAGDGEMDLLGVAASLRARAYAGPVYSEYEGADDVHSGTRESIRFLRTAFDAE